MPKRKREDEADTTNEALGAIEDQAVRIKASRLKAKLEQSNKVLKDAIQLARGFERQKLGRREKQAEKQPQTLLRLREEAIVVRQIDASKVAKDYLFKQFVKTNRIRDSPAFVALYGNELTFESAKSAAEANVLGRLFNSNPVKEVLPNILKDIRDILGLADVDSGLKAPVERKKSTSLPKLSKVPGDQDAFATFSDAENQSEPEMRQKLLDGVTIEGVTGNENEDNNEVYSTYSNRLVNPSEDDDDDGDTDLHNGTLHPILIDDISISSDRDIEDLGVDDDKGDSSKRPRPKSLPGIEKISKTTFLPTLSMGGYYSGSESGSEADDYDDRDRSSVGQQPRKNRRGQRARRGIAELKYGKNAKHLTSDKQQEQGRNCARGAPGTATGSGSSKGFSGRVGRSHRYVKGPTGANGNAIDVNKARIRNGGIVTATKTKIATKKTANSSLHPSWEAARKKKIENSSASFTGKKITFD